MPPEAIIAFIVALLSSLFVTPGIIRFSTRLKLMDMPDKEKTHTRPVPRIGGIILYLSMVITALLAFAFSERIRSSFGQSPKFWISVGIAGTIIFLAGLYDDIKHSSIWLRFTFQIIAALIAVVAGGAVIGAIGIPFGGLRSTGWFAAPLTVFWIVGVTNAFNLIDGLDGLAGGVGFISTATIFSIAVINNSYLVMIVSATLCGALSGFLKYNRPPAKIFLGDCGSVLIGYSLSILAILRQSKKTTTLAILIPVLIVGVPILDTLSAMGRRLLEKFLLERKLKISVFNSMFKGDRGHIHHILVKQGYTERLSVIILYGLSFLLAVFALIATILDQAKVGFIFVIFGIGAFFGVRYGWFRLLGKNGREQNKPGS